MAAERALSPERPLPLALGASRLTRKAGEIRFAGYAAVFDRADRSGDVVRRGAFRDVRPVPLLWQHRPETPIGRIEAIGEDARGLRVIARLAGDTQAGLEAGALLQGGALSGLSFGYRVRRSSPPPLASRVAPPASGRGTGTKRELTDLELVEVSLVTFPMQPLARVHAVEA